MARPSFRPLRPSRTRGDWKLTSTEMVLFELLRVSGTEEFKAVSRLVK